MNINNRRHHIQGYFRQLVIIFILCVATGIHVFAQNNTSSPFTVFGLGEIELRSYGITTGTGDVGIGVKSTNFLNKRNPAGLSGIDTLTFILDISGAVKFSEFSVASRNEHATNFNFKNLAVGFRPAKIWTTSVGLCPYSNVGYKNKRYQAVDGTLPTVFVTTTFTGSGGVNKFYWGNSVELIKGLSLGVTASYFFGSIVHEESASSIRIKETMTANKLNFDFGMQYSYLFGDPLGDNLQLTVGGVYGYKSDFHLYQDITINSDKRVKPDHKTYLPESFGVGFSLLRNRKNSEWLFAADYYQQNWSADNKWSYESLRYEDSRMYNIGFQITPNKKRPNNYLQLMHYQIGACYQESYMSVNGHQLKDYSVSMGVGLPFRNRSYVNVSLNLGQSGTWERGGITESYALLSINMSLIELWFAKQKYD
ncbi:MAG: hypothetical protein LBQ60_19540 [Bacteroidales bacterium]|jgi:hypothetical protein|nr:hypothetical protein [Bacteroidales bacterium]